MSSPGITAILRALIGRGSERHARLMSGKTRDRYACTGLAVIAALPSRIQYRSGLRKALVALPSCRRARLRTSIMNALYARCLGSYRQPTGTCGQRVMHSCSTKAVGKRYVLRSTVHVGRYSGTYVLRTAYGVHTDIHAPIRVHGPISSRYMAG